MILAIQFKKLTTTQKLEILKRKFLIMINMLLLINLVSKQKKVLLKD